MFTLNAENRNTGLKVKQLRKNGIVPGVIYGKDLEESLSIQFTKSEAVRFLKSHDVGSKAELSIGGKKLMVLLREATYKPATSDLEHLSFQKLQAGEAVTSTVRVTLLNREKVSDMVLQPQDEISYRALPSHLIDKIEIDVDGMRAGDSVRISDLDIAKNPDIEILSPLDAMLVSITEPRRAPVALEEEGDESSEGEAAGEADSENESN